MAEKILVVEDRDSLVALRMMMGLSLVWGLDTDDDKVVRG